MLIFFVDYLISSTTIHLPVQSQAGAARRWRCTPGLDITQRISPVSAGSAVARIMHRNALKFAIFRRNKNT